MGSLLKNRYEEKIYIFRKDERQPSWRNDDVSIKVKKYKSYKNYQEQRLD